MKNWKQKGTAHILIVLFLLSQFQIGTIYANTQTKLENQKEQSIALLDKVEVAVETSLEKIDEKINDQEISERIEQKTEEIEEYIEATQEKISEENSGTDIKEILQETKKVIVLKVVSGVTKYENVEENIPEQVADTPEEKQQAAEAIQESLETKTGDYTIVIKTKYTQTQALALFRKFDATTQLDFLYDINEENYFEVTIDSQSIFKQEMLEDIENGDIPETFLGIEIVKPQVFSIGEEQNNPSQPSLHTNGRSIDLTGEDLSTTWGIQKYLPDTYLEPLQEKTQTNKIKIGVIDTGIDYNHPDLTQNVSGGYDFVNDDNDAYDDQGHGTHVAGTIAAKINQEGIIGINPYAELIPLKICNQNGFCPTYAVTKALSYAKEHNINILNMSLGGAVSPIDNPICDGITSYTQAGGIVVAAAGNSDTDTSTFVPGGCADTITVAAIDQNNQRASFSNYGNKVDISAPGVSIYSTYPNNQYQNLNGTSMATPHVAGFISVMKTLDQDLTTQTIKTLLNQYQIPTTSESNKPIAHAIDVVNIIAALNAPNDETPPSTETPLEKGREEAELQTESTDSTTEIVPTLEFIENQINYSQQTEEEAEAYESEQGIIGPVSVEFGDQETTLKINSSETPEIETIQIQEQTETEKQFSESPELQSFGGGGEQPSPPAPLPMGEGSGEGKVHEVFLDGASKPQGVEINSVGEEEKTTSIAFQELESTKTPEDFLKEQFGNMFELPPKRFTILSDNGASGIPITDAGAFNPFFSPDGNYIVYSNTNDGYRLYKKNISETGNGLASSSLAAYNPIITQDGQYVISKSNDGGKLYKKSIHDTANGTAITSVTANHHMISPTGGSIFYTNGTNGYTIYKKNANDTANGSAMTSQMNFSEFAIASDDSYMIYSNYADGGKLYKKYINDNSNGTEFTSVSSSQPIISSDGSYVIYMNGSDGWKLYKKGMNEAGNGIPITSVKSYFPQFVPNGTSIIYINGDDGWTIYKKDISDASNGTRLTASSAYFPKFSPDGKYIVYANGDDGYRLYKLTLPAPPSLPVLGQLSSTQTNIHRENQIDIDFSINGITDANEGETLTYSYSLDNINYISLPNTSQTPIANGNYSFNLDLSSQADGSLTVYAKTYDSTGDSNVVSLTLTKDTSIDYAPVIVSLDSSQSSITPTNQASLDLLLDDVSYAKDKERITYSYSLNGQGYIPAPESVQISSADGEATASGDIIVTDHNFELDLSSEPDGPITLYAKANDGVSDSNIVTLTLNKKTYFLEAPRNFQASDIQATQVRYTWEDVNTAPYNETKYTLKDGSNAIIADNIATDSTSYTETGLSYNTSYQRKLCVTSSEGEECTLLNYFTTPYPSPEVHDVTVQPINNVNVYMPISSYTVSDQYDVSVTGDTQSIKEIIGNTKYNILHIGVRGEGQATVTLKEKGSNYTRYVINITIKAPEYSYTLHESDKLSLGYNSNSTRFEYSHPGIARLGYYAGSRKVIGDSEGHTTISVYKDGGEYHNTLIQKFHITVLPVPEVTTTTVTTEVAKRLVFHGAIHKGYELTPSKAGMFQIEAKDHTLQLDAISSGTATLKTYSEIGDYITNVYHITINPKPVQHFTCNIPEGLECETYWYAEDEGYSYTVSTPGIVTLTNKRHYYATLDERYSLLHIEGVTEGTTDIYIYKNGDHHATIQTNVLPAIQTIGVASMEDDIQEGQTSITQVTTGGGGYKIIEESENINASVKQDGSKLTITGKTPGEGYFTIKDQYNQTAKFWLKVRDVNLELAKYEFNLNQGQEEIVYFLEYYGGITRLVKNNDNVNIYLDEDEQGKYLKIEAKEEGITIFEVEDAQGNTKTGKVTVGPGTTTPENPEEPTPEVPEEEKSEEEKELEDFWEGLLKLLNINATSPQSLEVNSLPNAYRCELGSKGKFYTRPYNAECVEDDNSDAWKPKTGYVDLYGTYGNTVVSDTFYANISQYEDFLMKLLNEKIYVYVSKAEQKVVSYSFSEKFFYLEKIIKGLSVKQTNINNNEDISHETKESLNFLIDILRYELDELLLEDQFALKEDRLFYLNESWYDLLYASEKIIPGDGLEDLKKLPREQIETYAEKFAGYLFEYMVLYDLEFKQGYESRIETVRVEKEAQGETLTAEDVKQIAIAAREGVEIATRDYIMQYYDLAQTLAGLKPEHLTNGMKKVWAFVKNPIEKMVGTFSFFKEFTEKIYLKIQSFGVFEYTKGGSYLGTTFAFMYANPASGLVGSSKYLQKISEFINKLNTKVVKFGEAYLTKFDDLVTKVKNTFPTDKQIRFMERLDKMDDAMLKEYLQNQQKYIDDFEVGGKFNMVVYQSSIYDGIDDIKITPTIKDGVFYGTDNEILTRKDYLFVFQNGKLQIVSPVHPTTLRIGDYGHADIGSLKNVDFAGEITFEKGKVTSFSNHSGHYKPDVDGVNNFIISIKQEYGYDFDINLFDKVYHHE